MSPFETALVVAAVIFAACLLGIIVAPRLSEAHLSAKALEIINDARSLVTGLAALTLGLLIATANSSFEEKSKEIKHEATNAILVDRLLRDYGPQADRAREELRIAVQNELDRMNEARRPGVDAKQIFGTVRSGNIRSEILKLSPNNDREAWLKTTALAAAQDFVTSRWRIYHEMNSSIKWPLVYVAVFWIAAIFFSLGIKTPRNIFPVGGMLIASLAMAGAMYLMFEMDMPCQGFITVSAAPLESAVQQIKDTAVAISEKQ
ncbi:hypothetical protein [Methylocystis sp.]|uniref:bestrophin-like domain n=1 Tax=Methylocystis sp. TaxID=1911079 RepID=UPI003DA2BFD2